jgi:hypothetical protein
VNAVALACKVFQTTLEAIAVSDWGRIKIPMAEEFVLLTDAPINQKLVAPMEDCPENAVLSVDHCLCNAGYRPSPNASQCGKS